MDFNYEYAGIVKMFEKDCLSAPLKAFFGKMTVWADRRKDYPITLLKRQANLDQLLAIHNAIKYPVTYVQGPPGTGKSYSIINTIVTAFFNEKTVLLTSYNNHPLDTVVKELKEIRYQGQQIPFPVIRLGSRDKTMEALKEIKRLYEIVRDVRVFENTLIKNRDDKANKMRQLTALLKQHEEILDLSEQKEAIECLMHVNQHLTFQTDLQGRQLEQVKKKLEKAGIVTYKEALELLDDEEEDFRKFLYYTSVKYIKRLGEPKHESLIQILEMEDQEEQVEAFWANDAVSDEILLRHHYRCSKKIIDFNNKKYYNNKLCIDSQVKSQQPLVLVDVQQNKTDYKNTAPREVETIIEYVRKNRDKKIGIITPFSNQKEYISERLKTCGMEDVSCGTVHAFQGDEKDVILFSLAMTDQTSAKTYNWLKNNRELINVATSRVRQQLVVLSNTKNLERLHDPKERDDLYELVEYVKTQGSFEVTPDAVTSRALGIKPYSTRTEEAFLQSLNHALENIHLFP